MTTYVRGRKPVNHHLVAQMCRNNPGEWVFVKTYKARSTAHEVAYNIVNGRDYKAYRPKGTFESKFLLDEDTELGWTVYAKYVGEAPCASTAPAKASGASACSAAPEGWHFQIGRWVFTMES